ncbi:MAG: class I SAM-dependent methyltransferase [Acidobacteriaceae bacterium]
MHEILPSRTALRVALRRAAHQIHDSQPLVFNDPLAITILGREYQQELRRTPDGHRRPFSAALRAWIVVRSRLAEDILQDCVRRLGACQYLVLGAGLDTFACRNPYPGVRVFEVDHPSTQTWKLQKLQQAGVLPPLSARFVAVDFEQNGLRERLLAADFEERLPTVTAWLGVAPYLTSAAFRSTLQVLAGFTMGSVLVFDYSLPRSALPIVEQRMQDSLGARVAAAGEPFQLFFTPLELAQELDRFSLRVVEDLDAAALAQRFLSARDDALKLKGKAGRICVATVGGKAATD